MSGALTSLVYIAGIAVVGWYLWTQTDFLNFIKAGGNPIDNLFEQIKEGGTPGGGGGGSIGGTGATAAAGKMIYKGTGKVLGGNLAVLEAKKNWGLASGGSRPSTRFVWGAGKGKGDAKCVNYNSFEATVYAKFGAGGSGNTRAIVTGGGGGQRGKNCCVYSLGFVTSTGEAFAEEEGAHEPKPTIAKMPVTGGSVKNIGKLAGRTIGFKEILIRSGGKVLLEGWVDANADGNWKLFYRANNPHGGNLPVITKTGLVGETCGELRFRCDDIWPVSVDVSRSFVAELPDNASPASAGGNTAPNATLPPSADELAKGKPKKAKFAYEQEYDGNFHYLQHSPVSTLYSEY